jgi:hypothetical protein
MRTMALTMTTVAATIAAIVSHQTPDRERRTPGIRPNSMGLLHHGRAGHSMTNVFESESGAKPSPSEGSSLTATKV